MVTLLELAGFTISLLFILRSGCYHSTMPSWSVRSDQNYPAGTNPFGNRFYGYRSTNLILPDGRQATYHGVVIPDCIHVVAMEDDLTTYLVRQFRPNARANRATDIPQTLELPGGFQKPGLEKCGAANEELKEEIGKSAGSLTVLGTLFPSPGISNETDTVFLGRDLSDCPHTGETEATEQSLTVVAGPFGVLYDRMRQGHEPVAAQTLAAMAMAAVHL